MMFGLFLLAVSGGACFGFLMACVFMSNVKADLQAETVTERARCHNAHHTGDMMCEMLAEFLRRKDLSKETRAQIGDLLLRWGALRPKTTTTGMPGDFTYSKVTVTEGAK